MKTEQVPQDNSPSYNGQHRLLYATDEQGLYKRVLSTGWEVECDATGMAVAELREQTREAWERVRAGRTSPIEYYMHRQRMDPQLLAQATGLFQWRIKRHFNPRIFSKLNDAILKKYSDALGITITDLRRIPETPELEIRTPTEPGAARH